MKRKTLKEESDYEYCVRYAKVMNGITDWDLTPAEIKAAAGFFYLSTKHANVLTKKNQVETLTGLGASNVRSLEKRLIEKGVLVKTDRSEGYVPAPFIPNLNQESFEIHIQRTT
jgi:hypothetical protein